VASVGYQPRTAESQVLYNVVRDHLEAFLRETAVRTDGAGLPDFVEREFREFLTCGVLARGFARVRCGDCAFERLVAFSKVDDPCGAISVHGYCGLFGAIALGIFADGIYGAGWNGVGASSYLGTAGQGVTGLLYGDTRQFVCQLLGASLCAIWAVGATFVVFKAVNAAKSMRVPAAVELEGLDVPEFGLPAYPEDVIAAEA
jgi:ammonia channel protein AmtB